MKYSLASSSWDDKEINSAIDVIKSGNRVMGRAWLKDQAVQIYDQCVSDIGETRTAERRCV